MNKEKQSKALIKHLKDLITKGNAHATFEDAVKGVPAKLRGVVPEGLPYSLWQMIEHIRLAQWDILDFSRNPKYKALEWPKDYWPKEKEPKDADAWKDSITQIKKDRKDFIALLEDKDANLYAPIEWGEGQTLLREAMLIADHTSYHTAEVIMMRRLLGDWK